MDIFKPDGVIYQAISKVSNMVLLSLCWLICCIPIVTAGAATTALYAVCFKMIKDEDSHVAKKFFSYFKSNFRQATIVWLIMLPLGALIAWMIYLYFFGMAKVKGAADFFAVILIIVAVLYIICITYVFACAARYENTPVQTIKNGVFIGLKFIGRTVILLLITGAVAFVCLWNYTTMFLAVIFAPAFLCYVHSSFIMRIFESLEKARDEEIEDEKADNRIAQMKESAERI